MKYILIILPLFLLGCRKDEYGTPLTGEKAFFVGEWHLESSIYFDFCDNTGQYYLTPEEQGLDYRIKITEAGYISFYQNDTLVDAGQIYFPGHGFEAIKIGTALDPKKISFSMYLDGDKSRRFSGSGSKDSIRTNFTRRIGHELYPNDCRVYRDYFRRK